MQSLSKTHILHLEAEPQYSRSQVEPGNEIREVLPPVVQDVSWRRKIKHFKRSPVRREAFVMAFNDCFCFVAWTLLLSGLAILFFKKVKAIGGAAGH